MPVFQDETFTPYLLRPSDQEESVVFEQLLDEDGEYIPNLTIDIRDMTLVEATILRKAEMRAGFVREGPFFLGLVTFFPSSTFRIAFDPTVYPSAEWTVRLRSWRKTPRLFVLGIDDERHMLRAIRVTTFPKLFRSALLEYLATPKSPDFSRRYSEWLKTKYPSEPERLWELAEDAGIFGED